MKQVTFTQENIYSGSLRLINAKHPLNDAQTVREPLAVLGRGPEGEVVELAAHATRMLKYLLGAAGCAGKVQPVSGYRSRREQHAIFEDTLRQRGEAFTRKYVALPGCSEHETGLAIDLGAAAQALDAITPAFPQGGSFDRFRRFCSLYGFIERYPKDKCDVTGIGYEPWHYRYVGWPHARIMERGGWTLEEYIETLRQHTSFETALVQPEKDYSVHVFTLFPDEDKAVRLHLPEGAVWQASGNNVDGVVITVWK